MTTDDRRREARRLLYLLIKYGPPTVEGLADAILEAGFVLTEKEDHDSDHRREPRLRGLPHRRAL